MSVKIDGDAVFVSGCNHFVVTDRAARLNNGDAYRGCGIDAVAERKKASRPWRNLSLPDLHHRL